MGHVRIGLEGPSQLGSYLLECTFPVRVSACVEERSRGLPSYLYRDRSFLGFRFREDLIKISKSNFASVSRFASAKRAHHMKRMAGVLVLQESSLLTVASFCSSRFCNGCRHVSERKTFLSPRCCKRANRQPPCVILKLVFDMKFESSEPDGHASLGPWFWRAA